MINLRRSPTGDDEYTAYTTEKDSGTRHAQNGGVLDIACPAFTACLPGSVALLLDVGGGDTYHDEDNPSPGSGTDKCVFPKYESTTSFGQQRDWPNATALTVAALALPCLL